MSDPQLIVGSPEEIAEIIDSGAPLCARCDASYAVAEDNLCAACRHDVNLEYGDLPGGDE